MKTRVSLLRRAWSQLCLAPFLLAGSVVTGTAHAQSADPNTEPPRDEAVSVAGASPPSGYAAPTTPSTDPRAQARLIERERLRSQRIGIGGPLSMLGAGLALTAIAWGPLHFNAESSAIGPHARP